MRATGWTFAAMLTACAGAAEAGVVAWIEPASTFDTNTAAMDAALGLTGHVFEDFEDTALLPGLSITFSGGHAPVTITSLPSLFDVTSFPFAYGTSSVPNDWWAGIHALVNSGSGSNEWPGVVSYNVRFDLPAAVTSFGVGLSDFQSLSSPRDPATDHELFINGVSLGLVETLGGANWTPGSNRKNGYLRVTADGGDTVQSLEFRSLTSYDHLIFDHLAISPAAVVPLPGAAQAGGLLLGAMFAFVLRRRPRSRR